jgi:sugar phosphate isomerase/epimerase
MKRSQLAAQLFTLRDFIKTPEDVVKTFEKVRDIGYQAVQVSAMAAQIEEEDLAKLAADYGLTICATHEPGKLICEETDKVIDRLKRLNCRYTAYPHPHVPVETKEQVMALAEQLKVAAEKMQKAGLTLCYHNHAIEFERFDGELMLDLLYNNAPAMQAEIDTFWVQAGGQDPVSWINRFPGKQPLLHLKEFGIINRERKMLAIGNGNLDWKSIIAAGTACGVEYFIVEQDDCNGVDPFEEMRRSYNFIAENFFD